MKDSRPPPPQSAQPTPLTSTADSFVGPAILLNEFYTSWQIELNLLFSHKSLRITIGKQLHNRAVPSSIYFGYIVKWLKLELWIGRGNALILKAKINFEDKSL
ncbi:hypothetical protein ACFL4X_01500 [Gemmatimonadota bacterium]